MHDTEKISYNTRVSWAIIPVILIYLEEEGLHYISYMRQQTFKYEACKFSLSKTIVS